MLTIKEYSKGAIIYFEGDKSNLIYLLQSGKVVLIYKSLDGKKEEKREVKVGEFFGVRSSLGKYPREETAHVVGGARVVIFKPEEFQKLALKNTRLVLQMSKVFSRELREIHSKIREILKVETVKDPEYELMNVGESFYHAGNIEHAEYVFQKYLEYYPKGKFKERADMLLLRARKGDTYPIDIPSLEDYASKFLRESVEPSIVEETLKPVEEDELFQMPDVEESTIGSSIQEVSLPKLMEKIQQLVQSNQIHEAYKLILEIEKSPELEEEPDHKEQVIFEKARLLILLKNYKSGLENMLLYLKNYPQGKFVKQALLQVAIVFEILKDYKRAINFYKKVLLMKPDDEFSEQAKKRLSLLEK